MSKLLIVNDIQQENNRVSFSIYETFTKTYKYLPSTYDFDNYIPSDPIDVYIDNKYKLGYRIIIGNFKQFDLISLYLVLSKYRDLFIITTGTFYTTNNVPDISFIPLPINLIVLSTDSNPAYIRFKNNILQNLNSILLLTDPTLNDFPLQKPLITKNKQTFIKTFNIFWTDEDPLLIFYVQYILSLVSPTDPYQTKDYFIPIDNIRQGQLTPEAAAALSTTDYSNVFYIVSYEEQAWLNIITSNDIYLTQFIYTTFTSTSNFLSREIPYVYSTFQINKPSFNLIYQRIVYDGNLWYEGYVSPLITGIYDWLLKFQILCNKYLEGKINACKFLKDLNCSKLYLVSTNQPTQDVFNVEKTEFQPLISLNKNNRVFTKSKKAKATTKAVVKTAATTTAKATTPAPPISIIGTSASGKGFV